MEGVIEIRVSNGDSAEAETPEEAVYAARTLLREAKGLGVVGERFTADFYVDGFLVRQNVRPDPGEVWRPADESEAVQ